jgi:hypothetical protein
MEDFLNKLRINALHIKLESDIKYGGAVDIDSLIKILHSLNESFLNFIDAEVRFRLQKKITNRVNKEIQCLVNESKLLIVNLNFSSFEAEVSPDLMTTSLPFSAFADIFKVKKEIFEEYKEEVVLTDPNNIKYENLINKYSKEEFKRIYKPLADTIWKSDGYKFYAGKSNEVLKKPLPKISDSTFKIFFPKEVKPTPPEEQYYRIWAINEGDYDIFGDPKLKIKKVFAAEKFIKPVYPFQTNKIIFDESVITLKDILTANVEYSEESELFYISFPDLDILVWGEDRNIAEEAFNFTFASLVESIYLEKDINLTEKALKIKNKLSQLISEIKL